MNVEQLPKAIGFLLPIENLKEICYDASYQPQDAFLRKRNKGYISWGIFIIKCAYSVYIYREKKGITEKEFSEKLAGIRKYIEDAIYTKFSLEDIVLKSRGEAEKSHLDITDKLLVLIYQYYGFAKVYYFLLPFFVEKNSKKGQDYDDVDYKTKLQEYALTKKFLPLYEIVKTSGPDHEKQYTCRVSIGRMFAIGRAVGKKRAEKEAAKLFLEKYKINLSIKEEKTFISSKQKATYQIDAKRKKELYHSLKMLELNINDITYKQLNEALTHRSYVNDHPKLNIRSNSLSSMVGACVYSMLGIEYVFNNYDLNIVTPNRACGVLLQEDNLSKALSDEKLKYLLTGKSSKSWNRTVSMKIDVLKSLVGIMWTNYVSRQAYMINKHVKKYVYNSFKISSQKNKLDYRTFLQKITDKYNWQSIFVCGEEEYKQDNSVTFTAQVKISGDKWSEKGIGIGRSKSKAENAAAKDVLRKLPLHCCDTNIEVEISRMLDPELLLEYVTKKEIPSNSSNVNQQTKQKNVDIELTNQKIHKKVNKISESKNIEKKEISFDGNAHTLYIYKGTISCRKKGHDITSVTGILASTNGYPVKININYCKSCKLYFIGLPEYKYYQDVYGALLGNISIVQQGNNYNEDSRVNIANESILHICGYTVNQADNLSAEQRRKILGSLMDRNVISKYRVIEYLQFFINNSKYRYNMRLANQKWTDDLKWVREYNINTQRKYIIENMKKWHTLRK